MVRETLSNARTPLGYDLDKPSIRSSMSTDLLNTDLQNTDSCKTIENMISGTTDSRTVSLARQAYVSS